MRGTNWADGFDHDREDGLTGGWVHAYRRTILLTASIRSVASRKPAREAMVRLWCPATDRLATGDGGFQHQPGDREVERSGEIDPACIAPLVQGWRASAPHGTQNQKELF